MRPPLSPNDDPNGLWRRFNRRHGAVALTLKLIFWLGLAGYLVSAVAHAQLVRTRESAAVHPGAVMGTGAFLGLLLLAAAFAVFGRRAGVLFSAWFGLMLVVPAGTALYFAQPAPAPLFALLNGFGALLLSQGIKRPRQALFGGALCGFAFLTEYAGMLLPVFFVAFMTGRMVVFQRNDGFGLKSSLLSAGLCAAGFLSLSAPLLVQNSRQFGAPFHNADFRSLATASDFIRNITQNAEIWFKDREILFLGLVLFPLIFLVSVCGSDREEWSERIRDPETCFLLLYLLSGYGLAGWVADVRVDLRYLYPLQVVLALLFLRMMTSANPQKPAPPTAALLCLVLLFAAGLALFVKTPLTLPTEMAPLSGTEQP